MGLIEKYPYTNFAGINLDYYIKKLNEVIDVLNSFDVRVDEVESDMLGYIKDITGAENVITIKDGAGNTKQITISGIPNNPVLTFSENEYTSNVHAIHDLDVDDTLYLDGDISADDIYAAIKNGALVMAILKDGNNLIIAQPLKWSEDGLIYMELLCKTATTPSDVWELFQFTVQPDRTHSWESGNHYELTRLA